MPETCCFLIGTQKSRLQNGAAKPESRYATSLGHPSGGPPHAKHAELLCHPYKSFAQVHPEDAKNTPFRRACQAKAMRAATDSLARIQAKNKKQV